MRGDSWHDVVELRCFGEGETEVPPNVYETDMKKRVSNVELVWATPGIFGAMQEGNFHHGSHVHQLWPCAEG